MLNKFISALFVAFLLLTTQQAYATATVLPQPVARFFNSAGAPLAGGKVYTYAAGTTTPLASYTDSTALVQNTNPVILDSTGSASIWISGAYKVVLKDSNGVTQWTQDNIQDLFTFDLIQSTSTTSLAVASSGSKTWTTQSGKYYSPGLYLMAVDTANPTTNWMHFQVTSYIGTQLIGTVDASAGSGTISAWTISLSGPKGPTGGAGSTGSGSGDMVAANNLSDVVSASSSRTHLGLGTAAIKDVGTSANQVMQLDGSAKAPAVDGSAFTNLTAANLTGALPAISGAALTGLSTPAVTAASTGKIVMGAVTIQWGFASGSFTTGGSLNFGTTFSGSPYSVQATPLFTANTSNSPTVVGLNGCNSSGCTLYAQVASGTTMSGAYWVAIGPT